MIFLNIPQYTGQLLHHYHQRIIWRQMSTTLSLRNFALHLGTTGDSFMPHFQQLLICLFLRLSCSLSSQTSARFLTLTLNKPQTAFISTQNAFLWIVQSLSLLILFFHSQNFGIATLTFLCLPYPITMS